MPRSRLELIRPVFLAFLISILNIACAQTKADKIDELFNLYSKYGQFNGSVLITDKTEIIYKKGFGFANMEWRIPNQTDTKFRLASVSKQFTAMLIVQLASENKIKLDAPISSYLPEYSKKTGDIINIHHLLTHSSGIPDYTSFPDFRERMGDSYTPEEIVKLFADSTLEFTPGEKFQYSNSGYILLGYIIEKITGKPYEQVLQEKIFSPLKMSNSGYYQNSEVIKSKAYGYDKSGNTYQNASYIDMSFPFSAGGIYSTVEDLYLWDQALYTEKLLPQKYMDLLFNKYIPSGDDEYYAYGWEIGKLPVGSTKEELETISHQGEINGFNTQILRIPSEKSLIVLLNNTGGAQLNEMSMAINGILHNKPYKFPTRSLTNALLEAIEKDGISSALLQYKEMKNSTDYHFNENEMNLAGYQLLQSHKLKEAEFIFKLVVEASPNSYNAFDSYGESLMVLGDNANAIENYKKSLKLNPGNDNAIKKLKELGINTDGLIKKVPLEDLALLEGEYLVNSPTSEKDKNWKIIFKVIKGELTGNDRGYKYRVMPVSDNEFVNPADGASLLFDTKDKKAITLLLFGKVKFTKLM